MVNKYLNDTQLIELVKEGDEGATEELISRHSGIYAKIAYDIAPSGHLSAEIQQNCNDVIFEAARCYDESRGMKFGSWVGQFTRYKTLDILTDYGCVIPTDLEVVNYLIDENNEVDKEKEKNEQNLELINSVLKQVSDENTKKAVTLRFFSDDDVLSYKRVGEAMGVSHETARTLIRNFVNLCRNKLTSNSVCDTV